MNIKGDPIVVDVEADGPCPGLYSIVCFGAVSVENPNTWFMGKCRPLSLDDTLNYKMDYIPEALAVSGVTREEHESYPISSHAFVEFDNWLHDNFSKPIFVSDNPAFDWQFINYYFHFWSLKNPFGFSARRIGDYYAGLNKDWNDHNSWKQLRKTEHTHNPVDDARGNAEALRELWNSH